MNCGQVPPIIPVDVSPESDEVAIAGVDRAQQSRDLSPHLGGRAGVINRIIKKKKNILNRLRWEMLSMI